jgi:hypothetical protein
VLDHKPTFLHHPSCQSTWWFVLRNCGYQRKSQQECWQSAREGRSQAAQERSTIRQGFPQASSLVSAPLAEWRKLLSHWGSLEYKNWEEVILHSPNMMLNNFGLCSNVRRERVTALSLEVMQAE